MSEELKFCIDCKHSEIKHVEKRINYISCHHENNMNYNLVTGAKEYRITCTALRDNTWNLDNFCGKDAKWFEKK